MPPPSPSAAAFRSPGRPCPPMRPVSFRLTKSRSRSTERHARPPWWWRFGWWGGGGGRAVVVRSVRWWWEWVWGGARCSRVPNLPLKCVSMPAGMLRAHNRAVLVSGCAVMIVATVLAAPLPATPCHIDLNACTCTNTVAELSLLPTLTTRPPPPSLRQDQHASIGRWHHFLLSCTRIAANPCDPRASTQCEPMRKVMSTIT